MHGGCSVGSVRESFLEGYLYVGFIRGTMPSGHELGIKWLMTKSLFHCLVAMN